MEKREAQRKKFAAYKEKKKAQEEERKKKLAERPAWRPAGAAVTRRQEIIRFLKTLGSCVFRSEVPKSFLTKWYDR